MCSDFLNIVVFMIYPLPDPSSTAPTCTVYGVSWRTPWGTLAKRSSFDQFLPGFIIVKCHRGTARRWTEHHRRVSGFIADSGDILRDFGVWPVGDTPSPRGDICVNPTQKKCANSIRLVGRCSMTQNMRGNMVWFLSMYIVTSCCPSQCMICKYTHGVENTGHISGLLLNVVIK